MSRTLENISVEGKRVFLRVDFNVPIDQNGVVTDDTRIRAALKTIYYLLEKGAILTIATHFGRPRGEVNMALSTKVVVDYINDNKFFNAKFVDDCIGDSVTAALKLQQPDEVLILENLRFYPGEQANDPDFTRELARDFEVYVNDAFGTCHRKHASIYGVPSIISVKAPGFLLQREVKYFSDILSDPFKPFGAILGGAKVKDKIGVIKSLLNKANYILIGGAMAYTFLSRKGYNMGRSIVEEEYFGIVDTIFKEAEEKGVQILLPIDHIVSETFGGSPIICDSIDIEDNLMALDIGLKSVELYKEVLSRCRTILWNGPMGVFEQKEYANGTFSIAKHIATLDATSIVGGGDSIYAINKAGVADKITHISTGGGASLAYVECGNLPGIEILL